MQEAEKKMAAKEEFEKTAKSKTTHLSDALGAVEQMHTVVCQPEVGIAQGLGITLVEGDDKEGCRVECIIKNGVAECEGTLKPGDIFLEVDQVDVKGSSFEEMHGVLVGVAGSSVTISGMHAPYLKGDEFSALVVRSGFDVSPAHAMATIQVDELSEQVLKGAGELRNTMMHLKSQQRKFAEKAEQDHLHITALEAEKTALKQECADARAKYDSQVSRALELALNTPNYQINQIGRAHV